MLDFKSIDKKFVSGLLIGAGVVLLANYFRKRPTSAQAPVQEPPKEEVSTEVLDAACQKYMECFNSQVDNEEGTCETDWELSTKLKPELTANCILGDDGFYKYKI
jgi:hypothetical protein